MMRRFGKYLIWALGAACLLWVGVYLFESPERIKLLAPVPVARIGQRIIPVRPLVVESYDRLFREYEAQWQRVSEVPKGSRERELADLHEWLSWKFLRQEYAVMRPREQSFVYEQYMKLPIQWWVDFGNSYPHLTMEHTESEWENLYRADLIARGILLSGFK